MPEEAKQHADAVAIGEAESIFTRLGMQAENRARQVIGELDAS